MKNKNKEKLDDIAPLIREIKEGKHDAASLHAIVINTKSQLVRGAVARSSCVSDETLQHIVSTSSGEKEVAARHARWELWRRQPRMRASSASSFLTMVNVLSYNVLV